MDDSNGTWVANVHAGVETMALRARSAGWSVELTPITFELNGSSVTVHADAETSLLDVLREQLDIVSPKDGCQPQQSCGCCTVLIDGKPKLSCVTKAGAVERKRVTTLEGLSAEQRRLIADCFVHAGGVQCGFCIPGIAVRVHALLERNPDPSRDEILEALRGHLCRCTGYVKIVEAVGLLARARRGEVRPAFETSGKVGTSLPRYTGHDVVLGQRRFVADIKVPGMVHGALRLSDHPRALLRRIDTRAAEAVPGVIRVVTAADVPGDRFVGLIQQDWPIFVAVGEETRYTGDVLAAVAAEDERTARRAAELIEIDYEVREPVTDPRLALEPDAPRIHPAGNLLSRSVIVRGDADRALADSAHVIEDTYRTQRVEHLFLETEASIAVPEDGGLRVLSQGQGVFDDRKQIAKVLGWDEQRIRVELVSNGGAFGGKEDMSVQGQTAVLAALIGRPVKVRLTRRESFRVHPKRHPIELHYRVGCDAEGHLTAVRARMIGDTGAYASVGAKVLERTAGHATGPYRVPHVDIESRAVYTNNTPCGAMRGFGVNQAAFAIEGILDRLAERVGIDGWEIRWRNALDVGDTFCTGQRMTKPIGLKETLLAVKDAYRQAPFAGIACGIKNVGLGNGVPDIGRALLTVNADGAITIRTGFTEMGQGLYTICIQVACQETQLPPGVFDVRTDTSAELGVGQTTASRATVLAGNAIIEACKELEAALAELKLSLPTSADEVKIKLKSLAGRRFFGEWVCDDTTELGVDVPDPKTHLTYGFATQVAILDEQGALRKVIACHDVGRVMNPKQLEGQIEGAPKQLEGQIEGAIHMGLGYALTEEFQLAGGHIVTDTVKSLGVLRAHQMPEIEVSFVEEPDPECPYGARGVGEIGLIPTAPAVAGALYKFDGIVRRRLPMKDSPAALALRSSQRRG